jgi:hypothetical protein
MNKPKKIKYFTKLSIFTLIPYYKKTKLMWKDKFNTPRCENPPTIHIRWLYWELFIISGTDQYWEQWLWWKEYCNGDFDEAKNTWPWYYPKTKESTWINY